MPLFKLHSKFKPAGDQPEAIKKLMASLDKGNRYQTLLGVTGSGKTFTVANLITQFDRPVLVMAPNKALAAQLYREYKNFFPENSVNYFVSYYDYYQPEAYLPTSDTYIDKESMINEEIDRLRHQATSALMSRKDVIVVASVSCIYNLGVPNNYFESAVHLEIGQPMVRADLMRQLVKIQFARTPGALDRGNFRVRGDVFEIAPVADKFLYRIEIKDQKVAEISVVDALTKGIKENLKEAVIFPVKHFVSSEPQMKEALKEIKAELKDRLAYFKKKELYLEAERLERRTRYDLEMLKTLGFCHGIENYSRHLAGKLAGEAPDTLLAYFPWKDGKPDFLTIMDESHIGLPQVRGMYAGDRSRKEVLAQYGWRLPSALDNRPLKFDEFEKRVGQVVFTSATPGDFELAHSSVVADQVIRPTGLIDPPIEVRRASPEFRRNEGGTVFAPTSPKASAGHSKKTNRGQVDDIINEIGGIVERGERAIINVLTKKMAEELSEFLKQRNFAVNYLHSDVKTLERTEILNDFRQGKFSVLIGVNLLREGLDLPEVTLVAIMDADREGFLRSEESLMQTMGRAARNVSGKVILYADTITKSIKNAMKEVDRRRTVQLAYNAKHGITPETTHKAIEQFLDIPDAPDPAQNRTGKISIEPDRRGKRSVKRSRA
ncbi:MAG: excinuclease ABC subunit B [Candidatus Magasanikbacteria bacterium RIFOXYD2_FULL_39_9]|uniref:Excinuclease ABC subunit B n=1 Tax=Candidatus Magasanikbacteria bacterium RIFOXYD1_FULL_40_23 TaxID=1798705 RepID=A0A1F6P964_9BACT|nr:MAG: excinuclease ABC subunit B [Candidatus Magasanikbacteria bacterium RIFOXYD1_FULL_40_23]OGH93529.1 MAG: excinuclease ABC subunit B [Candidatus Magasanikbacteria bacterium RIFOXYD2_FULL_39_9]